MIFFCGMQYKVKKEMFGITIVSIHVNQIWKLAGFYINSVVSKL